MAKMKISVTIDSEVLAVAKCIAEDSGSNTSEYLEASLREANLRAALHHYKTVTTPRLGIDSYADSLYRDNLASDL